MKEAHPMRRVPAIRRAGPADVPGLVALCAAHAAYEGAAYAPDGQDERLRVALFGPSPRLHAWVAEGPEGLAGYMTATVDFATWTACSFVHMDCLYLCEGARGAGLGRALVEALCDFARRHGIGEIQWQTPAGNALGIGFYRRLGAAESNKLRYRLAVNPKAIPLPAVLGRAEATA